MIFLLVIPMAYIECRLYAHSANFCLVCTAYCVGAAAVPVAAIIAVSLLLVAWNESVTDAAGTSVDAQGCDEEIEKGFEAIARLGGELWTMV
jgi:Na+/H+-dicarboxylate symporter